MFDELKQVITRARTVIIYCPSTYLRVHIENLIKETIGVHPSFVVSTDKAKELHDAKRNTVFEPQLCPRWLINASVDDFSKKDLQGMFDTQAVNGLAVYWVKSYRIYMQIKGIEVVEKNEQFFPTFSFSRIMREDLEYLHEAFLQPMDRLDKKLFEFVADNYLYDVQAVLELFSQIRSGEQVFKNKDIIELIGVSGASIGNFVMSLLQAEPMTEKSKSNLLKYVIQNLDDLTVSYKADNVRLYMIGHLDAFIMMKRLQAQGYYNKIGVPLPNFADEKLLNRNRRYRKRVLKDVSLTRILKLRLALESEEGVRSTLILTAMILRYITSIQPHPKAFDFRKRKRKRRS